MSTRIQARWMDQTTPTPFALREIVGAKPHIIYFRSPKNNRKLVFCGQQLFFIAILLEADGDVKSYEPMGEGGNGYGLRATLRQNGNRNFVPELCEVKERAPTSGCFLSRSDLPQDELGASVVTDLRIQLEKVQIENWLILTSAMNRVANHVCNLEDDAIQKLLRQKGSVTLGNLLSVPDCDPGRMLGSIGRALQVGTATCDTQTKQLTRNTVLTLPGNAS